MNMNKAEDATFSYETNSEIQFYFLQYFDMKHWDQSFLVASSPEQTSDSIFTFFLLLLLMGEMTKKKNIYYITDLNNLHILQIVEKTFNLT